MCITGLSQYYELDVLMGIRRFALNRPDWEMGYVDADAAHGEPLREVLAWKPDGILIVTQSTRVPELLRLKDVPTVIIDRHHDHPPGVSRIEVDDEAVGRRAAEYFLKNRFSHLAVAVSPQNPLYSSLRADGFAKALAARRITPHTFQVQQISGRPWFHQPELNAWLESLPKPVGIYCVQDMVAQRILEQCRELGLHIPSEVSVLGTDNHRLLCEAFRPFLSSIPQPLEACGFRAAELLQELLEYRAAGKTAPVVCERIAPGDVVERQSTSLRAIADPAIAKAANYLHDHLLQGGSIDEAVRVAGINRRSLERGFQRHLGVTPGQYMNEVKIDHAKRLLTETELRMSEVAEACGMVQEHFATFFRKQTGQTPSAYRRKMRR
jgi:LacI family transcriptional regulator